MADDTIDIGDTVDVEERLVARMEVIEIGDVDCAGAVDVEAPLVIVEPKGVLELLEENALAAEGLDEASNVDAWVEALEAVVMEVLLDTFVVVVLAIEEVVDMVVEILVVEEVLSNVVVEKKSPAESVDWLPPIPTPSVSDEAGVPVINVKDVVDVADGLT